MKLYITPGSPFARIARIVAIEKGLADRIEFIVAQTRTAASPYYAINPSGRVPYLVRDDGVCFEESSLICDYFDRFTGEPMLGLPAGEAGWAARRLEALARSLADGISVWGREVARAEGERSPTTIAHETARLARMADLWEREIAHPWMTGALNMAQITLACGLGYEARIPALRSPEQNWRRARPRLAAWFEAISARPSFVATAPPVMAR
jgi:glutathione S-transferase